VLHDETCFYCTKDERLDELMIPVQELSVSTLYLMRDQAFEGRCIVAFREHKTEIFQLTEAERNAFFADLSRAAEAIYREFGAAKLNYAVFGGRVPHFHVHLVPKRAEDADFMKNFIRAGREKRELDAADYAVLIERLRKRLAE